MLRALSAFLKVDITFSNFWLSLFLPFVWDYLLLQLSKLPWSFYSRVRLSRLLSITLLLLTQWDVLRAYDYSNTYRIGLEVPNVVGAQKMSDAATEISTIRRGQSTEKEDSKIHRAPTFNLLKDWILREDEWFFAKTLLTLRPSYSSTVNVTAP